MPIETIENRSKVWIKVIHEFNVQGGEEYNGLLLIEYCPIKLIFEKVALRNYVHWLLLANDAFSIESVIQYMAQECANILNVHVKVKAHLSIKPEQRLVLECSGMPEQSGP
jgi:ABC-type uncharacterized transport system YnjBCD permease subunit